MSDKTAVILMNLGTPSAPTHKAVRAFLREFLSDRRVVEVPRAIWWLILYGIILPLRVPRITRLYQDLWREDSPLRTITQQQAQALQHALAARDGDAAPRVVYAMSYGEPRLSEVLESLRKEGVERFFVLPLFPQYSATTTGALYDQWANIIKAARDVPDLRFSKSYHDHPLYIEALAASVELGWQSSPRAECLLMSFHGIPQRYVDSGDPYYRQCQETARLLAARLHLADDQWTVSFQSRLGRARWLQPYTTETLSSLAASGVASVDIICPAFAADSLETLEEIAVENRQRFLQAGGRQYTFIPCLNASEAHIRLLLALVDQHLPQR